MTLSLNVNVQMGVTPQLATFLTALLQSRTTTPVQLPATEASPEPAESEKPRRTRRAKTDTAETAAPMEAVEEAPEAPQPATEISIGERIREIMHRTRQRFEGEDYKDNTDSEAYKKYHRALTSQFKQIAMQLGHEKPSYLDTAEKVDSFAEMCDALIIDEKGFIAPPPAPF